MVSIKPNCTSNQVSSLHSSLDGTITPKSISECLSVPATASIELPEAAITTTEKAQNAVTAPKSDFCVIGGLNAVKVSSASNPCPISGCTDGTCARLKRDKTVWFCSHSHDSTGDRDGFVFQERVDGFGRFLNVEEAEACQEVAAHFQAEREALGFKGGSQSIALSTALKGSIIVLDSDTDKFDLAKQVMHSQGKPIPTSESHPCPVCDDAKGHCRLSRSDSKFVMCAGFPAIVSGRSLGIWFSYGATKNGRWCKFRAAEMPPAKWDQGSQERYDEAKLALSLRVKATKKIASLKLSLTAQKRHEGYTQLLAELTLHPDDLADLLRRGLTLSEIAEQGYKSVSRYPQLKGSYHPLLPGIKDGKLLTPSEGYLCPVQQADGLIVACQVRLRGEVENRYRWLSGGEGSLHLYSHGKELPVNVNLPQVLQKDKPAQIWLVDSVAAKGAIAANKLGVPVVGAAGGMFANSPGALKAALDAAAIAWGYAPADTFSVTDTPPTPPEIVLSLDAGDAFNKEMMNLWYATEALLKEWGYPVSWAWWGQSEKATSSDIDEIDLATTPIKLLGTKELQSAIWNEAARIAQIPLRTLSFKANLTINTRYMYDKKKPGDLERLLANLPESGLWGWRVPKGGGKSTLIAELIERTKRLNSKSSGGRYVLSICPRIILGMEQATRWNITWIGDKGRSRIVAQSSPEQEQKQKVTRERLESLRAELSELEKSPEQVELFDGGAAFNRILELAADIDALVAQIAQMEHENFKYLGLCWDSLWKYQNRDMSNSMIIMDEAELGVTHLLTSETCRRTRPEILDVFERLIQRCLGNGGTVILADADLTDIPIDYINSLLPKPLIPFIIYSNYRDDDTTYQVQFRTGSRDDTVDQMCSQLLDGEPLAVTLDNKKEAIAQEKLVLMRISDAQKEVDLKCAIEREAAPEEIEAIKARKTIPLTPWMIDGKITQAALDGVPCIININSDTTRSTAGKNFVAHVNEEILRWKPLLLIYTPSMGVGVSIDETTQRLDEFNVLVPYFARVYGFFFVVIEPGQARQQLSRIRANVSRVVWAQTFGLPEEGCNSYFPDEVNRSSFINRQTGITGIEDRITRRIKDEEGRGHRGYDDDGAYIERLYKSKQEFWNPISKVWTNPHIVTAAKLRARRNYSRANFAKIFLEELIVDGHHLTQEPGVKTGSGDELKNYKEEEEIKEAIAISASPAITPEEAKELRKKGEKTLAEEHTLAKHGLEEKLPEVELTPDLVLKAQVQNRGEWLMQQRRFYWLLNFEAVQEKTSGSFVRLLKGGAEGTMFTPDFRPQLPKIAALKAIRLLDLIDLSDPEKEYEGNSAECQEWMQNCVDNRSLIFNAFGEEKGMKISKSASPIALLKRLLKAIGLGLKDTGGRIYKLNTSLLDDPDRATAQAGLERAWQRDNRQKSEGVTAITYGLEPIKIEALEPPTASQADIGESVERLVSKGDFGTTHEPQAEWVTGYTLLELPTMFRDHYLLEDIYGARIPAYEGGFRVVRSSEKAEAGALDLEKRCLAEVPALTELELSERYQEIERSFNLGLIGEALLSRVIVAIGRAGEWFEASTPIEFPMLSG